MLDNSSWPDRPEDANDLLADALDKLQAPGRPMSRDAALALLRRHLARAQAHVQEHFESGALSGLQAGRLLGRLLDGIIAALHRFATAQTRAAGAEPLTVAATGGYGRGVLAPFSDIDLLFGTRDGATATRQAGGEYMLKIVWDLG